MSATPPLDARELARTVAELLSRQVHRDDRISYSPKTAAAATGLSVDVINRAIRAGDLAVTHPKVDKRRITSNVILRAELDRWLADRAVAEEEPKSRAKEQTQAGRLVGKPPPGLHNHHRGEP